MARRLNVQERRWRGDHTGILTDREGPGHPPLCHLAVRVDVSSVAAPWLGSLSRVNWHQSVIIAEIVSQIIKMGRS